MDMINKENFKGTLDLQKRGIHQESKQLPQLTLYTGTNCQLCDVAKSILVEVKKNVSFRLQEYNIRDNTLPNVDKWRRAYQYGECLSPPNICHRSNKTGLGELIPQKDIQTFRFYTLMEKVRLPKGWLLNFFLLFGMLEREKGGLSG